MFEVAGESDFEVIAAFFGVSLQYRPIVDLFERLDELAQLAAQHAGEFSRMPTCLDPQRTKSALQYLRERGLRRQGIGKGGNPARGLLEKSPLSSAVIQAPDQHCKATYDGLCILLLLHCREQRASSAADEASREIRLSARSVDPRNSLISQLPSLSSGINDYHFEVRERLKSLENERVAKPQQKLFHVLQNITSLERKRVSVIPRQQGFSSAIVESKKVRARDALQLAGFISRSYEPSIEPDEPPNSVTVFKSDTESEPVVFEFAARKAKSWVQKSETLSRVDTSTLNELEKKLLTELLKLQLEKDFDESVIGFAIALIYLLGLELEQVINTRWGAVGFINLQGQLLKRLPPLPKLFRSADDEQQPSTCLLKLPSLLTAWLEKHSHGLAGSDSLLAATGRTGSDFISTVHDLLKEWRQNGQFRFKLSKITASLSAALTYQSRDPLVITALSGDLKSEPPVLMYYRALSKSELSQAYDKATHFLLDIPEDLFGFDRVGRAEVKLPHHVYGLIEGVSNSLRSKLKGYPANIIQSHNALMHFTLAMLMFATGHRPVRDPFCWWEDFSLEFDGVLISDKAVSPRHEYRYAVIPDLVKTQINVYRRHLRQLGARLYRDKSIKRQQLGMTILISLEPGSRILPCFFEIDGAGKKYYSMTQKSIQAYWQRFAELSANVGRSVMSQLLSDNGVSPGLVELYLGHIHGLSHRHGQRAGHAVAIDFVILEKEIEWVMKQLGWKLFNPYRQDRVRLRLPKRLNRQLIIAQRNTVLGPEKRKRLRLQRQGKIKEIVANARYLLSEKSKNKRLQKEQVDAFFNTVKQQCYDAGLSIQSGVNLASRWLYSLRRRGVSIEPFHYSKSLPTESSIISPEVFRDRQLCKRLQSSLLREFSTSHGVVSREQALVELVITAAIFGGLAKPEALKALPELIFTDAYRLNGQELIVELGEQRWRPDPLSMSRMIYLRRRLYVEDVEDVEDVEVRSKWLQKNLALYLKKHSLNCSGNHVFKLLSKLAKSLNVWNIPGAFQGYFIPHREGRHLPLHRLATLLDDKPYVPQSRCETAQEQVLEWIPRLRQTSSTCLTATSCWRDIKSIFSQVEASLPLGAEKRSRALRAKLAKLLREYAQQDDVTLTGKVLIAWLVARCRTGIGKESLALSTIKRYASEIVYPLLALADSDLRSLDEDAFEALYLDCLESCVSDKTYRLGRLYDFHLFLQDQLSLPSINWSALYTFAGIDDVTHSADANILTVNEYDLAIQAINSEAGLTSWLKARYTVVLMLGYRFGLRFGEAFKLRVIDIQRDGNKIFLQVRGSVYGDLKTRSGVRQIPLIGTFCEHENIAWEAVFVDSQKWTKSDHQTLFLFNGEEPRRVIDKNKVQSYLNSLLKSVSSDNNLRFHHLRHTFANRLIAHAYNLSCPHWKKISRRLIGRLGRQHLPLLWSSQDEQTIKLQAISDVMGHASIRTTMTSYFHFPEVLGHDALSTHYEEKLSPKMMAYLLGRTDTTIQKRYERYRANGLFRGEPIKKLFPLIGEHFHIGSHNKTWRYSFSERRPSISLQMIDRILVRSARARHMSDTSEIIGNHSNNDIESVLKNAAIVQVKTGFNYYQVPSVDPDAIGIDEEAPEGFQENLLEAERLHLLLSETALLVERLSTDDADYLLSTSMLDGATWQDTRWCGKGWYFAKMSSLLAFIELMAFLPVKGAKFTLIYPSGYSFPEDKLTELLERCPMYVDVTSRKELKKGAMIKVISLPPSWKTAQTLNRVLFCLCVLFRINSGVTMS